MRLAVATEVIAATVRVAFALSILPPFLTRSRPPNRVKQRARKNSLQAGSINVDDPHRGFAEVGREPEADTSCISRPRRRGEYARAPCHTCERGIQGLPQG